jgi:NADPH:quinone reductase-like Zn-dependent oxidoreductase
MGREHRCLKGQGIGHSVDGGFAEYVKLSAFSAVKVPRSIPFEEACILGCPIGVAYRAMKGVGQLHAGETVLVTGAGGGLGSHSVQISKALGARVLAVTTSSHKVEALSRLGADHVLLSPGLDFHWEVLALTEERGVDLVVDTVGSLVFQPVYESLGQFGRWVLIGQLEGQNVSFNPAIFIFKDLSLLASSGVGRKDLRACVRLVQGGKLTPQVTAFPLEEAKRALELLGQRQLLGRAVLTP